ncbi:MAG: Rha family transcriptional regulator [Desulfitobacteriaceae bacterium]
MNNLTVINHDGVFVVDSREVAEMVEKEHKNLLRDINGYCEILTGSNLSALDFFIASTYPDAKGESRP